MSNVSASRFRAAESLLDRTLAAATQDPQTVTAEGRPVRRLVEGVAIRDIPTHGDERGTLFEVYDARWNWHPAPLVSAHCFTIRPGFVKGWVLHETHDDRSIVMAGEVLLALFDPRPDSSTYGMVCEIFLSGERRQLVTTPKNVWHAAQNIGGADAMVLDFPSLPYDHERPDKHRLPIDTPLIPYSFGNARGW